MNNFYCNPLNFSYEPFKSDFDFRKLKVEYTTPSVDNVNPEIVQLLKELNIQIHRIDFFYKEPREPLSEIHIDGQKGDYAKINWIYGGKNSKMIWYDIINETEKDFSHTIENGAYTSFQLNEVTPVYENDLLQPSLVQVGVPHAIYNPHEVRYCISLVLKNKHRRLQMSEACTLLKDYLL